MTRIRFGGVIAAAAILFAACTSASTTPVPGSQAPASQPAGSQTPTGAPTTAPSAAIKQGGTLVVVIPGEITRTDTP